MDLFSKKSSISIEFCSDEIKVVEGKYNKKNIIIDKSFSIDVPDGLYSDGVIQNVDKLSNILERGLSDNGISRGDVYGVINSSHIIIREISIPKVEESQIDSILKYQLDEFLPVDPDAYVVQYILLNVVEEDGVEKQNIMLVGVPKEMVETHLNLLKNIGLKPAVLDYVGNAIAKLIKLNDNINDRYENNITIACVDIETEDIGLSIIEDGILSVSRIVRADILPIDPGSNIDDYKEVTSIRSNLNDMLERIDMVFRYYTSRRIGNNIDLILLYGTYSNIEGIEELISNYYERPSLILSSLNNVKFDGDLAKYANPIGTLIRLDGVK